MSLASTEQGFVRWTMSALQTWESCHCAMHPRMKRRQAFAFRMLRRCLLLMKKHAYSGNLTAGLMGGMPGPMMQI
jgi:hypothetical protein